MCMRYFIGSGLRELKEYVEKAGMSPLVGLFENAASRPMITSGEVRPTDVVPVIAPDRKENISVFPMKWGFTLQGSSKPLPNARVETASVKPTFAESWSRRRCIIPSSYYFEWEHYRTGDGKTKTGDKYMIRPSGEKITWLCGLYRFENGLPVFTVLTRPPSKELAVIHDRMPVILPEARISEWISPSAKPESLLEFTLTDMIMEKAASE